MRCSTICVQPLLKQSENLKRVSAGMPQSEFRRREGFPEASRTV